MTSVPVRLALFAALLALVFGVSAAAGGVVDPGGTSPKADGGAAHGGGHDDEKPERDASHGEAKEPAAAATLPGLSSSEPGLRLRLERAQLAPSRTASLTVHLEGDDGAPLRESLDVAHDKRLHLIVVRRDTKGFQHLHPTQGADGSWTTPVDLRRAGTYRVLADVTIRGSQRTVGIDLQVPGTFEPIALPAARDTVLDDRGLEVRRRTSDGRVAFDVLRAGAVINAELEDYLGAKGHLVTLRVGDLAYLHTHPDGERLAFDVDLPTAGAYRSWVQFQLDGVVHTAAFTEESR